MHSRTAAASRAALGIVAIALAVACGSSSETSITAPTTARCAVTLSGAATNVAAAGGQGQIGIGISRECAWNARSEAGWITLLSEAAGQGEGSVSYAVAANPAPVARRGTIVVNDSRVDVSQAAAACAFTLSSPGTTVEAAGGTRAFSVVADGACGWTASSSVPWLRVTSGASGAGNGNVAIEVAANTAAETRTGQVSVGGASYAVTQLGAAPAPSQGCAIVIEPASFDVSAQAGVRSARLTTSSPSCTWSLGSSASWLSVRPASGTGSAQLEIVFTPNPSTDPRLGTLAAGETTVTVSQAAGVVGPDPGTPSPPPPPPSSPGCSFAVASSSQAVPATGGEVAVTVTASDASCTWSASSGIPWITVSSGTSASGSGTARFAVAANTATEQRSASVTVAGQSVNIVQQAGTAQPPSPPPTTPPAPCTFTVAPASVSFPSTGGERDVTVTASAASCTWTSTVDAAWLTIVEGANGSGNGRVRVRATEQTARAERRGTLTAAGQAVAVVQEAAPAPPTTTPPPPPACTFSLAPATQAAPAGGGTFETALTASAATCTWTATSSAGWLTISSAASGAGSTTVRYTVAANTATSSRTGTLTVGGQTLTVTQVAAPPPAPVCTFTVAPASVTVPDAGGSRTTRVTASAGTCGWTARSNASWLTITAGASGTGSGDVAFSAEVNLTPTSRTGTLTVAGQTVTVTQPAFQTITVDGEISSFSGSCPNLTFTVGGRTVETSSATTFANGNCSSLRNGREVRVFGLVRPGNRIFAITVTRDDD